MIFSVIDLPDPLAPRMIFVRPLPSVKLTSRSTIFSSNASCTCSSATTGCPFALVEELNEHLRDEEVHRDDGDRSGDDGDRRRLTDALRAAARAKADVA